MKKGRLALWAFAGAVMLAVGSALLGEATGYIRYECTDAGVVESIDRVNYRTAYVTLEDGRKKPLSQPRNLVPGSTVCFKKERILGFEE